jgi:hypothetical protein
MAKLVAEEAEEAKEAAEAESARRRPGRAS